MSWVLWPYNQFFCYPNIALYLYKHANSISPSLLVISCTTHSLPFSNVYLSIYILFKSPKLHENYNWNGQQKRWEWQSKTINCIISTQDKEAVSVAKDLRMPQFELEMVTAKHCDNKIHMGMPHCLDVSELIFKIYLGNYSCLVAQFHLKRSISFHLIQNYLPSILIVAVSWVSFWMDIESVPGRISLGVITLLAVSNQASGEWIYCKTD